MLIRGGNTYKEKHEAKGEVELILRDRDGNIVKQKRMQNLIVSSGKALVANLFRGTERQAVSNMAVGSGTSPPFPTDVKLENELSPRRPFDKNIFTEESNASVTLQSPKGKDVLKLVSRDSGEGGNKLEVRIMKGKGNKVTLLVNDRADPSTGEETYANVDMTSTSSRYLINEVNENSKLVYALVVGSGMVAPTDDWVPLIGGSDAVVTLSSTFGYEDANGILAEAGIFNSGEEGTGTMYNRVVFPEINKTDKLTLTLIWRISF